MGAAAKATTVAVSASKKLPTPPASQFAELLRRSRFSSFDPSIHQTYSSPPSHAHRGDWGLKRPLPIRRKNEFISISSFEHHAHFTEWNRAEDEVRFIRRIDEMDVTPKTNMTCAWYKGLGTARTEWLIDSEFCPEDGNDAQAKLEAPQMGWESPPTAVHLEELGKRGQGAYGAKSPLFPSPNSSGKVPKRLMPNINAMSPKQFKRYLKHLRSIRPSFKAWVEANRDKPRIQSKTLYQLAKTPGTDAHRLFMQDHIASQLSQPEGTKVEPIPHRNAALNYAHPTALDTLYRTPAQPGMVLNAIDSRRGMPKSSHFNNSYVASFGGLAATMSQRDARGRIPLLDPRSEKGVDTTRIEDSIARFRLTKNQPLTLITPPRVVSRKHGSIDDVRVDAKVAVTVDGRGSAISRSNPYRMGSAEYVSALPPRDRPPSEMLRKTTHMGPARKKDDPSTVDFMNALQGIFPTKPKNS